MPQRSIHLSVTLAKDTVPVRFKENLGISTVGRLVSRMNCFSCYISEESVSRTTTKKIVFRNAARQTMIDAKKNFSLIAFELERYFTELTEKQQRYKLLKPKQVSLATVCKYISANLCYLRSAKSIYDYVRLRRSESQIINPIKVSN